jgi:hypothetical protein
MPMAASLMKGAAPPASGGAPPQRRGLPQLNDILATAWWKSDRPGKDRE